MSVSLPNKSCFSYTCLKLWKRTCDLLIILPPFTLKKFPRKQFKYMRILFPCQQKTKINYKYK